MANSRRIDTQRKRFPRAFCYASASTVMCCPGGNVHLVCWSWSRRRRSVSVLTVMTEVDRKELLSGRHNESLRHSVPFRSVGRTRKLVSSQLQLPACKFCSVHSALPTHTHKCSTITGRITWPNDGRNCAISTDGPSSSLMSTQTQMDVASRPREEDRRNC